MTLNTALVAPMPSASDMTAVMANPGRCRSSRRAYRKSEMKDCMSPLDGVSPSRVGCCRTRNFDDAVGAIGVQALEKRVRDVVHRNADGGAALRLSAMRVTVKHHRGIQTVDRFLEAARPQKRKDRFRFSNHGLLDGCVVEQRNLRRRAQPQQRRLELQNLVQTFLDERLHDRLAPRPEGV